MCVLPHLYTGPMEVRSLKLALYMAVSLLKGVLGTKLGSSAEPSL